MNEFYLTQTALKDLEKDETCPDRWRALWLDKQILFPSNEDMDKGKYFEYLALGGGATTDEVTDLTRLASGKKSTDQLRIEEQAARFKRLFNPEDPDYQGFTITKSQIELKHEGRKGTIDFETKDAEGNIWINDLKLTRDTTNTRTKYGWGNDWHDLDLVQMIHYQDLYTAIYGIKPKIGIWVFDYTPEMRCKFGEIVVSDRARNKKEARFNVAYEVIELYKTNGWIKLPSEQECRNCTLACELRHKASPIQKQIVNI